MGGSTNSLISTALTSVEQATAPLVTFTIPFTTTQMIQMTSKPNMSTGTVAIAMVKRQIMIVQAARQHTKQDRYIDVHTYTPFGECVFLASTVPDARISPSDILAVISYPLPSSKDQACALSQGMLELSQQAFMEYIKLNERHQKKYERMWSVWTASH